jgi:hypothetical protein
MSSGNAKRHSLRASIHTPDDGRGTRRVLVNDKELSRVFFADTQRGIARYYRHPLKLDRWRKRVLSRTKRGRVEVLLEGGA